LNVIFRPAAFECRLISVTHLHDIDGKPTSNYLVLGQVVGVHIQRKFITSEGLFDTAAARPIARCGYLADYAEVTHVFRMRRPANDNAGLLEAVEHLKHEDKETK
jgi:flavin reductase (DIM6/NTAB) family NADH-FMN oxidoreductase RutF